MKPPLWLLLHAAAAASTEQLFLLVTEPRSGSDWLVDLYLAASSVDGVHDVRAGSTLTQMSASPPARCHAEGERLALPFYRMRS